MRPLILSGGNRALATAVVLSLSCLAATAQGGEESYPLSGIVGTSLAFNHSNFVSTEQSEAASSYGIPEQSGFGTVNSRLGVGVFYNQSLGEGLPPLTIGSSLGFSRALQESFSRAGLPTSQPKQFVLQDSGVSLNWNPPIGFQALILSTGLSATIPLSRSSQSIGLITRLSPNISLTFITPIKLFLTLSAGLSYNFYEDPTIQVDCELMPEYCAVSGADLGAPNQLLSYNTGLSFTYISPIRGLRIGGGYSISAGLSTLTFENDSVASPFGQVGNQFSFPGHSTRIGLSYGFRQPGGGSAAVLDAALSGEQEQKEPSIIERFTFGVSMSTFQSFYSSNNKRVTVPVFDLETQNKSRTTYIFSVRANL
ncbi:MAG: hypothetical protein VYD19_00200 [Myxococcota bacterium]|nr:hypothetical protein [Myxococcota bacterium]